MMDSLAADYSQATFTFTYPLPSPQTVGVDEKNETRCVQEQPSFFGIGIDGNVDTKEFTTSPYEASLLTVEGQNTTKTKRKRSNCPQDGGSKAATSNKRRKTMGRPNNDWTPSRSRKLVRLYLMTDLTIEEIIRVLRAKDFAPCKRDAQNQLSLLLQSRPNQIRGRKVLTKSRLRLLRECRETHHGKQQQGASEDQIIQMLPFSEGVTGPRCEEFNQPMFGQTWCLNRILDPEGFASVKKKGSREGISFDLVNFECYEKIWDFPTWALDDSPVEALCDTGSLPSVQIIEASQGQGELSPSINDVPSFQSDRESLLSAISSFQSPDVVSRTPSQQGPNTKTSVDFKNNLNKTQWNEPLSLVTKPDNLRRSLPSHVSPSSETTMTSRPKSFQSSVHSIRALQRRLTSRSESCLGDVWSVMQNLTISGSSTNEHPSLSRKGSTAFSTIQASFMHKPSGMEEIPKDRPSTSSDPTNEHRVDLPGNLVACAMAATESLQRVQPQPDQYNRALGRLKNLRGPKVVSQITESAESHESFALHTNLVAAINNTSHEGPYSDIDDYNLDRTDCFGNSVLHIAASLGKPVGLLLFYLIKDGTNVHATNRAGETFLHLLPTSIIATIEANGHFSSLLNMLQYNWFDFHQRDCLGRTSLHRLLQPGLDKASIDRIIAQLSSLKVPIPTCRDSSGYTIQSQLTLAGISEKRIKSLFERKHKLPVSPNYAQTAIETVADLLIYERQADLLRTVRRAWSYPQYEDQDGRNGLHCLAEVSFALPRPDQPPDENVHKIDSERRQEELQALLDAGVDIDNYDKEGSTPLMAFIIHSRDGEDDEMTEKLLSKLCGAGADVNRRDRQGQAALHIAVKLGKKIATGVLLRWGANIHARDGEKRGVIALGAEYSKKAKRGDLLYAQIMLCIDQVVRCDGVAAPTFLQEWGPGRVPQETKGSRWDAVRKKISL
ncbi:ankyrin [Acephala macrosclerotiorum]|nr:ankyrin [Acephala macrosclerotiorum]